MDEASSSDAGTTYYLMLVTATLLMASGFIAGNKQDLADNGRVTDLCGRRHAAISILLPGPEPNGECGGGQPAA